MLTNYLTLGNSKIEIRYVQGEDSFAHGAYTALDAKLPSISGYFHILGDFPRVTVVLVPNRDEFDRLVRDLLQVEIEVPSNPARIAQPQRTDMVVLSPPAYEEHSIFKYVPDDFGRLLVHELVHMMEELLSLNIEESPRWWSEGLAVYLSEQCLHEDGFRQAALEGIAKSAIPGFDQIETEVKLAYEWGWTIVQFVEAEYGVDLILRIVKECADGAVFRFLEADTVGIEKHWRDWLLDHEHLL